jgi:hypothetical protein
MGRFKRKWEGKRRILILQFFWKVFESKMKGDCRICIAPNPIKK